MTNTTIDLAALSAPDKLLLAQQLLDSVLTEATPITAAQMEDVHRRAASIDRGDATCESWDMVRARLMPPA